MEELGNALYLDDVPESWTRRAYPSMSGLAAWFVDLLLRIKELESWTSDFCLPNVVWLSGFFNPQSFLTAIEQSMARKNEWPLDKMALQVNTIKLYTSPNLGGSLPLSPYLTRILTNAMHILSGGRHEEKQRRFQQPTPRRCLRTRTVYGRRQMGHTDRHDSRIKTERADSWYASHVYPCDSSRQTGNQERVRVSSV